MTLLLGVVVVLLLALLVGVALLARTVQGRGPAGDPELDRRREQDLQARAAALTEREAVLTAEQARLAGERAQTQQARSEAAALLVQAAERAERDARAVLTEAAARAERESAGVRAQVAEETGRQRLAVLEQAGGLSVEQARAQVVEQVTREAHRQAAVTVRTIEAQAREQGEGRARAIVADAVQRVASAQTAESVVTVLALPDDEMKGRIIGREGRNIRAYEQVTGVNLVIDDTPDSVLLSCFDPVRREIGRVTLAELVKDGRISPPRIEEVHERARQAVLAGSTRAGEDAVQAVGLRDVHPELVELLGQLRLRTSYGQNVLGHLVETAHIAGMLASELRMDPTTTKRAAFLHDIGKALSHEVEGPHAAIGADLARRLGESDLVVHAIAAHHDEVAPETVEAVLTQASDSCSGSRPGARRESLERYVQRLERLEAIASARPGVERAYAVQAGREVRIMVVPEQVDDAAALVLAQQVARQIEDELTYPGQVRVTVVRESRVTQVAR